LLQTSDLSDPDTLDTILNELIEISFTPMKPYNAANNVDEKNFDDNSNLNEDSDDKLTVSFIRILDKIYEEFINLYRGSNKEKILDSNSITKQNSSLIINQLNKSNIEFCWNGTEYELIIDRSFWEQPYTVESFIDKVSQQYASEVILGESQKIGFQPIKYQTNLDGSNTIILQRWNQN